MITIMLVLNVTIQCLPRTTTSAVLSQEPELLVSVSLYLPLSPRTERLIVITVFLSYLSIVILKQYIFN